jgi:chromosome segregation ATPase
MAATLTLTYEKLDAQVDRTRAAHDDAAQDLSDCEWAIDSAEGEIASLLQQLAEARATLKREKARLPQLIAREAAAELARDAAQEAFEAYEYE